MGQGGGGVNYSALCGHSPLWTAVGHLEVNLAQIGRLGAPSSAIYTPEASSTMPLQEVFRPKGSYETCLAVEPLRWLCKILS